MSSVVINQKTADTLNNEKPTLSMNPKKFALWLIIVTIIMIFASMTSAYIVRRAEGNWLEFELPSIFWINSAILLLSSITMQLSLYFAKRDNVFLLKFLTSSTVLLGIAFLYGQYKSWGVLVDMKVFLVGNPSGSFLYVLTGLHAFHLVTGLVFLFIVCWKSFRSKISSKRLLSIQMCNTYWHFLDFLWIYLFIFLLINH